MRNRITAAFLLLLCGGAAAKVSLTARIDSPAYLIGDWITVHLELSHPAGIESRLLRPGEKVLKLEVAGVGDEKEIKTKDGITRRLDIKLTSFDSGYFVIPPFHALYRSGGTGRFDTASSEPIIVTVHSVKIDPAGDIKDIKAPLGVPWTFAEMAPWIFGGLLLLLLAAFLIWWFFMRKRGKVPWLHEPVKLPHQLALDELEKLEREKMWQRGMVKEYYIRLTDIVRGYMEGRFRMQALEQTTGEIISGLTEMNIIPERRQEMVRLLTTGDLAKFAKYSPAATLNEECMHISVTFVKETIPAEEPAHV